MAENLEIPQHFIATIKSSFFTLLQMTALTRSLDALDPFLACLNTMIALIGLNLLRAIENLFIGTAPQPKSPRLVRRRTMAGRFKTLSSFMTSASNSPGSVLPPGISFVRMEGFRSRARIVLNTIFRVQHRAERSQNRRLRRQREHILRALDVLDNDLQRLLYLKHRIRVLVHDSLLFVETYYIENFQLAFDILGNEEQLLAKSSGTVNFAPIDTQLNELVRAVAIFAEAIERESAQDYSINSRTYFRALRRVLRDPHVCLSSAGFRGLLFENTDDGNAEKLPQHKLLSPEEELLMLVERNLVEDENDEKEDEDYEEKESET